MKPLLSGPSNQLTTQGFPYDNSIASAPPVKGLHPLSGNGPNILNHWAQRFPKSFRNIRKNSTPLNSGHHEKKTGRVTSQETHSADRTALPCNSNMPMMYNVHSTPVIRTNTLASAYEHIPSISNGLDSRPMLMPSTSRLSTPTVSISSPWGNQGLTSPLCSFSSKRPGSLRSMKAPKNITRSPNPQSSIDLIDACGFTQVRPNTAKDRVKAIGMRIFGEDVADRNMFPSRPDLKNEQQNLNSTVIDNTMSIIYKDSYLAHKQSLRMMTEPSTPSSTSNQLSDISQSSPFSCDSLDNQNQKVSAQSHSSPLYSWLAKKGNNIIRPNTACARLDNMRSSSLKSCPGDAFDYDLGYKSKSLSLPRPYTSRQNVKTSHLSMQSLMRDENSFEPKDIDILPSREPAVSKSNKHLTSQSADLRTFRSKMAREITASRSYSASLITSGINNNLSPRGAAKKSTEFGREISSNDSVKSKNSKKSYDTVQAPNPSASIVPQENDYSLRRNFSPSISLDETLKLSADIPLPDDKINSVGVVEKLDPIRICSIRANSQNKLHVEHSTRSLRQSHSMNLSKTAHLSYSYSKSSSMPSTPLSISKEPLGVIPERPIADTPVISIGRLADFPAKSINRASNPPNISIDRPAESPVIARKIDRNTAGTSDSYLSSRKSFFPIRFGHKDPEILTTLSPSSKSSNSKNKTSRKTNSFSHNDKKNRVQYHSYANDFVSKEREYEWHSPRPSTMMTLEENVKSLDFSDEITAAYTSTTSKGRSLSLSGSLFSHGHDGHTPVFDPRHHLHQFYYESSNNSDEDYIDDNSSYEIMSSPPVPDGEELLFHDDIYGTNFGGMLPGLCIQSPIYICQAKQ